jgi:SAM-dependent methyltransferase
MHDTAFEHMKMCIDVYLRKDRHYKILDLGSRKSVKTHATHRDLLTDYDVEYTGADVGPGGNVDVVMKKPYRIPAKSNSFDVVITNQVFEHIPFFWASFLEMCRVVKPGGLIFLIAPSRGQRHGKMDCWRYYPDSMRALAAFARVNLREMYVDLPPSFPNGRPNYAAIDNFWGDAVGVFRKPKHYSKSVRVIREALVWWCNRVGGIDHIAKPKERRRRRAIGRPKKEPVEGSMA